MPLLAGNLPRLQTKKLSSIRIDDFRGGVNVLFSETRLKKNEAKEALNLMLIEDGIWEKRWGTDTKITFGSTIDGFAEYVKSDLTTELIVVSGGSVYKSTNLSTTSTIAGSITLTAGNKCFFVQIGSNLYIGNGVDKLIRYNGSTLAQYSALVAMGTVTPTRGAGLSSGSFNYYYKVTAVNAVGETTPSAEATIAVNKDRDSWTAANENIALAWTAVSGALKYQIYFSDTTGFEVKLDEVSTNAYTDDGSAVANPYIEPPTADTSSGPELKHMWISGNRIWGTEPDNPYRVYFSGAGVFLGNFAPAYGGGWIELEKGGRATVVGGCDYQGKAHVICQTPEGRGTIWQIVLESQSVSGTDVSYIVPVPTKIVGSTGSNAPRSIILVENDVWMVNKNGATMLGNEPGVLNVLRTNEVSAKLRPYFRALDPASIEKICAYYYDAKVFISVPTTSGDPNRIILYDRERLSWVKDWSIGVSQFGEFTDSTKETHFLGSDGVDLVEFSSVFEDDSDTAFNWRYISPRVPVSDDWTQFAKIKRAYLRLRNTTGTIDLTVSGTGKRKSFRSLASGTIEQLSSDTGMGWDLMGDFQIGDTMGEPTVFAEESLIRYLTINKLVRDLQWQVEGDSSADKAAITGLMAKGFLLGSAPPGSWKL